GPKRRCVSRLRVGLCPTFSMWEYCQTPNLDANDWLFMYSGEPSNADLIAEEMRLRMQNDSECLTRPRIRTTLQQAFRKQLSHWASSSILSPFDLDIDEFKKEGRSLFGEKFISEMATKIN